MGLSSVPVELEDELLFVVAETTCDVVPGLMVVMSVDPGGWSLPSNSDVEAAGETEQTAIALALHRQRRGVLIGHHDLGRAGRALIIVLRELLAQREFQRVVGGLETGLLQRALELV